jgi:hypothetical protein
MQHFKIVAAILAVAVLAGHSGFRSATGQPRQDTPTDQDTTPPALQEGDVADENNFDLAAAGAQAPVAVDFERHLSIRADLTATDVVTRRLKILVPAAIQPVSQQQLPFIEGMQALDIVEAFTEKLNGKRIQVDPANIITRDGASGSQATYLRDLKQRTILFPDVGVGDTLVMTIKIEHLKSLFPGQFTDFTLFPRNLPFASAHVTVEAPAALGLRIKTTGNGATDNVEASGDVVRHSITIVPAPYQIEEPGSISPLDRDPAVRISTFKSYEEMGLAFGNEAMPKAAVTPEIAALSDEITRNIAGQKAQAVAIDAWIKKNIRYVAVYLSLGRVVPNDAATILKNKFGDCKDKVTLMSALLAAKGIASEAVLVNLGNAYSLPEPPTLGALNHVILYLPDFNLYDDPTAALAGFGVLTPETYDKPVVRVSSKGAHLAHIPAMRTDDHTAHAMSTLEVAADGTITGRTQESNTGFFGMTLRAAGGAVQSLGDQLAAERQLQGFNTPGSGRFDLGNIAETTDPAAIAGSFKLAERFEPPSAGGRTFIPFGMPLTGRPGNMLLGSRVAGRELDFVCLAGRQTEDITVTFDKTLPMPVPLNPATIDDPVFSYRSTFAVEGRTLKIHRELISRVPQQTCPAGMEMQIANDLKKVFVDEYSNFAFGGVSPPAVATAPRPPQIFEVARTTTVGQKRVIEFLLSLNTDCSSMGFTNVRVIEQPKHGNVTVANATGRPNFPQDNPRSECNKKEAAGTLVAYEPQPDFTGADSVTIDVTFASGSTTKRHYSIAVNPASSTAAMSSATQPVQQVSLVQTASPIQPATTQSAPQTVELRRVAAADQLLHVAFVPALNPDCSSIGFVTVRVIEQPKHGKVSVENGTGFSVYPQNDLRFECNKRKTDGINIFYSPDSRYFGADSITVDLITPDGGFGKRHYSIDVR